MEFLEIELFSSILQFMYRTAKVTLLIWLVHFCWNKWKLYRFAAKIPGPPGYPIVGNALDLYGVSIQVAFETGINYFKNYPHIFRIWFGPKLLIGISKPEDLEIILNHQKCLDKEPMYRQMMKFLGCGLITAPIYIWRRHRKLIQPIFNKKILNSFMAVFNENAKTLNKAFKENLGDRDFDIFSIISITTLDIMCESSMDTKVNAQHTSNNFNQWLDKCTEIGMLKWMTVWYHNEFLYNWSKYKKIEDEVIFKVRNFATKVINNKKTLFEDKKNQLKEGYFVEEEVKWKCFLDRMLQLSDEKGIFTDEELNDEVNTLIATGCDTMATTVSFFLLLVGMHPHIQRKLYEEVLDVLGSDRDVSPEDLPHLQYLERCLKESMRILPTVPMILRTASADIDIGHVTVPENSSIIISIFYVHRCAEYWKDPLKFDPDRFLPEEIAKRHPYSYLAFSSGIRGCLGPKFATLAVKTILATILREFVVKTEYKSIEEIKLDVHAVLRPIDGYKVSLEVRE